ERRIQMNKKAGVGVYLFLIVFVFLVMFPFIWVFLTSIKPVGEIFSSFNWFTKHPTFESYIAAFTHRPLALYMINSFVISTVTTLLSVRFASFAAYALTRLPIKGKGWILGIVLAASMLPQVAIIAPMFDIISGLNLRNSLLGLVIPYISFSLWFFSWVLSTLLQKSFA